VLTTTHFENVFCYETFTDKASDLRERDNWGDPGVDGRIILRWIFRKWDVGVWIGLNCLRVRTGGGHL
jgi:hypothetical protein